MSIDFALVDVIAFFEELTWILINDILVSIIIEHWILLKLSLIDLFFLQSLVHLQSSGQILFTLWCSYWILFLSFNTRSNLRHYSILFILLKCHEVLRVVTVFHLGLKSLSLCVLLNHLALLLTMILEHLGLILSIFLLIFRWLKNFIYVTIESNNT